MKTITKIIEDAYLKGGNDAQNHGLWKITSEEQATKYATEVVNKNDLLPDVSQQRELLLAYSAWIEKQKTSYVFYTGYDKMVEDFLSQ